MKDLIFKKKDTFVVANPIVELDGEEICPSSGHSCTNN